MTPKKKSSPVIFQGLEAGLRMFRVVVVILLVLFAFSGMQNIEPGNIGLHLHLGRVLGASEADKIKQPGLLLAWPYPVDRVIQVPVKQEGEVVIEEMWKELDSPATTDVICPLREGYCVCGDQNIFQTRMVAKYKITDPVAFQLWNSDPERLLHDVVSAALVQTVAAWDIDDVLRLQQRDQEADGLEEIEVDPTQAGSITESLATTVRTKAQARLDALGSGDSPGCGMAISALEFKEIHPPRHVFADFERVQTERIYMETQKRQAEGFAAREIPKAESQRDGMEKAATADTSKLLAKANADLSVFQQLYAEYKKNPELVWQRIYMDTIEEMFQKTGKRYFLSPESRVILSDEEGQP